MFPYWILFAVFAVGAFQNRSEPTSRNRQSPLLIFSGLALALMIGLRFEVGADWGQYIGIFNNISYHDFRSALAIDDPGYVTINWLVNAAGYEIWAVNLVCGAIFAWGLIRFAGREPNPWLACTIAVPYLIIVVAMGYTRQAVAIGIILAGLARLDEKTLGRFVVYILIATTFHKSAVIMLPIIAFAAVRQRFATAGALLLSGVVLYFVFVDASIDRMVTNYVDAEMQSEGAGVRVAMNMLPAILYLLFQKRFQEVFHLSDMQRKVWRNMSLASIMLFALLIFTNASTAVDRIALYLIPVQLFVWGRLPHALGEKGKISAPLLLFVIAYSALIQFVWLTRATHAEYWLPYQVYPYYNKWDPTL